MDLRIEKVSLGRFIETASPLLDIVNGPQDTCERVNEFRVVADGLYLAWEGLTCVGCVAFLFPLWNRVGVITLLAVAPENRCCGVGRALVATIEKVAVREGIRRIALQTASHAEEALAFWLGLGFVERDVALDGYLFNDIPMVWLDKVLCARPESPDA